MKFETCGHTLSLSPEEIEAVLHRQLQHRREHPDLFKGPSESPEYRTECLHCGRHITLTLNNDECASISFQYTSPSSGETPRTLDNNTPCPLPTLQPTTVRFTCKSGRIALGNDLRTYFPNTQTQRFEISNHAAKVAYIQHHASHNYITGFVGNTHVWFVPKDGGLDVVFPGSHESRIDENEWRRLDRKCVHETSTELWWFAIVDAADLPEDATDTYDRKVGFMDLPPGDYEVVIQPETSLDPVVATLRPLKP